MPLGGQEALRDSRCSDRDGGAEAVAVARMQMEMVPRVPGRHRDGFDGWDVHSVVSKGLMGHVFFLFVGNDWHSTYSSRVMTCSTPVLRRSITADLFLSTPPSNMFLSLASGLQIRMFMT